MKKENFVKIQVQALSSNEAFVRNAVAAFCLSIDPTVDQLSDVKTAVSEAITNSVIHAYGGNGGLIEIDLLLVARVLHIEIRDFGQGADDIEAIRKPFFTTKPDEERSGMGFTIMESFMDELTLSKTDGGGLTIKMVKNFDNN
ncbi:MAG: anti-sigma F factor [Firmicutes bacterium]|nr:anti-sigma F factor [Bacillota bacterium]MCL2255974.1 anti-sigma F factor [Bacillota bacterium]